MNFPPMQAVHKRTHSQFTIHAFAKPTKKAINKTNFMQAFYSARSKRALIPSISLFPKHLPRPKKSRFVAAKNPQKLPLHRRPFSLKSSHPNPSGNFSLERCHCTSPDLLNCCKFDTKNSNFLTSHQKAINSALLLYLNHTTTTNGNNIVEKNQTILCKGEKVLQERECKSFSGNKTRGS